MIIEEEYYLEHFGVKGMKWGVRRQRRVERLARAGQKNSPYATRTRASQNLGPVDLIRGRGVRGGAARKAVRVQGQLDRYNRGKATTMDKIKRFGSTRLLDLVPVKEKNINKPTTVAGDKAFLAASGALLVANMMTGGLSNVIVSRLG